MKKLNLNHALFTLMAVSVLIILTLFASCAYKSGHSNNKDGSPIVVTQEDVNYVAACLEKMSCQRFNSTEEFLIWRQQKVDAFKRDSVIIHIPTDKMYSIAKVVHNKYNIITPDLIYKEYTESYKNVYKYIENEYDSLNDTIEAK